MKSRGVAVIAAFVLIALAIFVRGLIAGDDGGGGSSDGPTNGDEGGRPVVACSPELIEVCDALALDGEIAPRPPTLDLEDASSPDADIDGWITWSPAPEIANFSAGQTKVWDEPAVLGSAREAVLIDQTSAQALPAPCRTSPTWRCLAASSPDLTIGVGDPATAEGIARLAPLARTFTTDDDYTQLDTGPLDDLIAGPDQQDAAPAMADRMAQPGFVSMTTGPKALLQRKAETSQGKQRGLRVIEPSPSATLVAVLAPRHGRAGDLRSLACGDLADGPTAAIEAVGVTPCRGTADAALAGFLFQVQKKVG